MGESVEVEPHYSGNGDWASSVEIEVSQPKSLDKTTQADIQVGFRLKRKETPDLFDSEELQAAFIAVCNSSSCHMSDD